MLALEGEIRKKLKREKMVLIQESFMGCKRSTLLFILVAASLISASFAGNRKLIVDSQVQVESVSKEYPENSEDIVAHARILTAVKTNDYGSYDPSPSLEKPPFKLIPN